MTVAAGDLATGSDRRNVAILGDSGVGKSALVNAIFGEERAPSGMGAPITQGADYYLSRHEALGVWDFWGFEHGGKVAPVRELREKIDEIQEGDGSRAISVAWFCWDASNPRVTAGHRALLQVLAEAGVPVIGVLTKVLRRGEVTKQEHGEFAEWIEDEDLGLAGGKVFLTAVVADVDFGVDAHGLAELLRATLELEPASPREFGFAPAGGQGAGAANATPATTPTGRGESDGRQPKPSPRKLAPTSTDASSGTQTRWARCRSWRRRTSQPATPSGAGPSSSA